MVDELRPRDRTVEAAWRVLIEVGDILIPLGSRSVLVGGWIPYLLFGSDHIGSIDVDVLLDLARIQPNEIHRMSEDLIRRGYRRSTSRSFTWIRNVQVDSGNPVSVEVDFLSTSSTQTKSREIETHGLTGCEIALRENQELKVSGKMPDGTPSEVVLTLPADTAYIVTKGMALMGRSDPKDAYDIYFCIKHFPGGARDFGKRFEGKLVQDSVLEALAKIRYIFRSVGSEGPRDVVSLIDPLDDAVRERLRRDAYEQVNEFLNSAGIP